MGAGNSRTKIKRAALVSVVDIISAPSRPAVVWRRPVQRGRSVLIGRAGGLWRTRHCRLDRIKCAKHTHSAALACDHAFGGEVVRSAIDACVANAAIIVADENAAFLVDG